MFQSLVKEEFDLLIHAGDYSGNKSGAGAVSGTIKLLRSYLPTKEILTTLGNHDFWCAKGGTDPKKSRSLLNYSSNYQKIVSTFANNNIHFLDEQGPYISPNHSEFLFFGCSGWYSSQSPPTVDLDYLPLGLEGGSTPHLALHKRAWNLLDNQLTLLETDASLKTAKTRIFISHFPIIKAGPDYKGRFEDFSWSERIGDLLQREYGVKHFLNGHAHQLHQGPLRWECGSDYRNPKYLIMEI